MTATKSDLFRQTGPPIRIAGRGHRMFAGEAPPCSILVNAQSMAGCKMPSEHLAAPAAFQANGIIAMDGSPDRHRGRSLSVEFATGYQAL
jgi:hypothetical protein